MLGIEAEIAIRLAMTRTGIVRDYHANVGFPPISVGPHTLDDREVIQPPRMGAD